MAIFRSERKIIWQYSRQGPNILSFSWPPSDFDYVIRFCFTISIVESMSGGRLWDFICGAQDV